MIHTWSTSFIDNVNYFDLVERDSNYRQNLIALSFIWNSVERSLFDSIVARITMPNSRSVYQAIKKRFNKASWSSIIHHANLLFNPTDQQSNLVKLLKQFKIKLDHSTAQK
ncbi:hypothetical protein O181_077509 [Austropuccinia psidii MF-1]|uniref:Uncharacterized protein n=1 Tax=Austropuccinia psidii MF-1 TaxID=1389203 RepID=A0A9Q3FEL8_9BASI|nr:hypothetical protein [Austropuccinia psidii MF-1]